MNEQIIFSKKAKSKTTLQLLKPVNRITFAFENNKNIKSQTVVLFTIFFLGKIR